MAPILEVKSLRSGYGRMEIIHGVDLSVEEGEIVAIIGPNGAGKTTLLNSIFGIAKVFSGKVLLKGEDITGAKPSKVVSMGVGYAPQLDNVFPNLTVEDNLIMGAYVRGRDPKIEEDIKEVFKLFPEIARRREQLAKTLSGGERQMLAVARALMARPQLLLLDEPTAGLAPKAASILMKKIAEIRDRGVTVVLVEQNVRKALKIADKVYVMASGRIVKEATPKELEGVNLERLFFGLT